MCIRIDVDLWDSLYINPIHHNPGSTNPIVFLVPFKPINRTETAIGQRRMAHMDLVRLYDSCSDVDGATAHESSPLVYLAFCLSLSQTWA